MSLQDLLTRVEAATGPDRELDLLIVAALAAPSDAFVKRSAFNDKWCIYLGGPSHDLGTQRLWENKLWPWSGDRLLLTTNIDAALELVERLLPAWEWDVNSVKGLKQFGAYLECDPAEVSALAPTAPLAILAALLRALIAQEAARKETAL